MADITDPATRSRMMAGIKGKNTSPEIAVRKALHARGFRFRLHAPGLPGRPDLVLTKYGVAIFVHGCFWHQHGCSNSNLPQTRASFWAEKLNSNTARDARNKKSLLEEGWRVAIVWECTVRHAIRTDNARPYDKLSSWIRVGKSRELSL